MIDARSSAGRAASCSYVALLTGGRDKPYAYGLATELHAKGVSFDLIGSNDLDIPEIRDRLGVNFLNLRGDQRPDANAKEKVLRVLKYYAKLIRYAWTAKPKLFHILWHNKFDFFDRTLLLLYYKSLGKRIVFTAHNVNAGRRDCNDGMLNRLSLLIQYRLVDHVFVHTTKMKTELMAEFRVPQNRVTVIPFGINNAVPNTGRSRSEARMALGIPAAKKVVLFFGNIAAYKGLEDLVTVFRERLAARCEYQLIIAGQPKEIDYWGKIRQAVAGEVKSGRILVWSKYIPDEEIENFFRAADVLVLPYKHVYQSGVLFLAYSFGLPVLAADVGSLKDEIVEGRTGFVFKANDPDSLMTAIERYFASDLYADLDRHRPNIEDYARELHSWDTVGRATVAVYQNLLGHSPSAEFAVSQASKSCL